MYTRIHTRTHTHTTEVVQKYFPSLKLRRKSTREEDLPGKRAPRAGFTIRAFDRAILFLPRFFLLFPLSPPFDIVVTGSVTGARLVVQISLGIREVTDSKGKMNRSNRKTARREPFSRRIKNVDMSRLSSSNGKDRVCIVRDRAAKTFANDGRGERAYSSPGGTTPR